MGGWQPIETAPKDGRVILAYRPLAHLTHDQHIRIVWTRSRPGFCWEATVPPGRDGLNYTEASCYATHWMPLPEPPAT